MYSVDAAGLGIGDEYPTRIMGVLNVSEESPYDPSVYDDPADAAHYVDEELIGEGADIVDIGLESANKRFEVLSAEAELDRLHVATETIDRVSGDAVFSIETRYHEVAEAALEAGFDMVNDVCGFADPEMPAVCASHDVAVAKMASPPDLERPGAVEETDWASRRSPEWAESAGYVEQVYEALKQHGFTDKTIVDPAFGAWSEAQTLGDDRETFRRLREFRALGRPMLVSINRKNFLGDIAGRETGDRLPASLAATSLAIERGTHVVRTHDVAETRDAARIGDAFTDRASVHSDGIDLVELEIGSARELRAHLAERGVDPSAVDDWRTRIFEVDGLTPDERTQLRTAAADCGATVVAVPDGRALLVGSDASVSALSTRARDCSGRLESVTSDFQRLLD